MANLVRMIGPPSPCLACHAAMPVLSTTPLDASPARKTETKTSRQTEGAVALPRKRRAKAARGEEIVVKTGLVVEVPVGGVGVVFFFPSPGGASPMLQER
jgi:hypothetical protein